MRLAELVADGVFVDGDSVESKDQDPEGDVRLIQLADVGDGVFVDKSARFLTSSKARELKCTFLEPGDILIARMPDPLGRACIFPGVDQPCVTVVDVCIVRPGKRADRRWLLHAINSPSFRKQIERHIKGTTRQRISRTNLGTIELNVPELPEQRRIADILDKADAIRRKRKEAIALTEELLRSAFLDMFGDPVTNPKGWPVKPLGDWRVVPRASAATAPYLRFLLAHDRLRAELTKTATGTSGSMLNVSMEKLRGLRAPFPPIELQKRFAALVWRSLSTKAQHQSAHERTEDLFNSRVARAFSGGLSS